MPLPTIIAYDDGCRDLSMRVYDDEDFGERRNFSGMLPIVDRRTHYAERREREFHPAYCSWRTLVTLRINSRDDYDRESFHEVY